MEIALPDTRQLLVSISLLRFSACGCFGVARSDNAGGMSDSSNKCPPRGGWVEDRWESVSYCNMVGAVITVNLNQVGASTMSAEADFRLHIETYLGKDQHANLPYCR